MIVSTHIHTHTHTHTLVENPVEERRLDQSKLVDTP